MILKVLIYSYLGITIFLAIGSIWWFLTQYLKGDKEAISRCLLGVKPKARLRLDNDVATKFVDAMQRLPIIVLIVFWPACLLGIIVTCSIDHIREKNGLPAFCKDEEYTEWSKKWARKSLRKIKNREIADPDIALLNDGLESAVEEVLRSYRLDAYFEALEQSQQEEDFEKIYDAALSKIQDEDRRAFEESQRNKPDNVLYAPSERITSRWSVVPTKRYQKSIRRVDPKTLTKIADALTKICFNPKQSEGNTIKPLKSNLEDCWRYRIGDNRLIYKPDQESHKIILIAFSNRSEAYS